MQYNTNTESKKQKDKSHLFNCTVRLESGEKVFGSFLKFGKLSGFYFFEKVGENLFCNSSRREFLADENHGFGTRRNSKDGVVINTIEGGLLFRVIDVIIEYYVTRRGTRTSLETQCRHADDNGCLTAIIIAI